MTVAHENGRIIARASGQPDITLIAESEFTFADAITGDGGEFIRDADGRVTGIEVENFGNSGRTTFIRRVVEHKTQ